MHWPVVARPTWSAPKPNNAAPRVARHAAPLPAAHTGRAAMTGEQILLQKTARVAPSLRAAIGATIIGASVLAGTARAHQGAAQSGSAAASARARAQTLAGVAVTAE